MEYTKLVDVCPQWWMVRIEHVETIKFILLKMAPAVEFLKKQGYHVTECIANNGVHERDTGYESFEAKYHSFEEMSAKLCADFTKAENELDGLWFTTLNFDDITVRLQSASGAAAIHSERGRISFGTDQPDQMLKEKLLQLYRADGQNSTEGLAESETIYVLQW